jgi:hypothetical protein
MVNDKDEDKNFQVSTWSIWAWIEEIVKDSNIVPLFQWDSEWHYKYDDSKWERFIDEP